MRIGKTLVVAFLCIALLGGMLGGLGILSTVRVLENQKTSWQRDATASFRINRAAISFTRLRVFVRDLSMATTPEDRGLARRNIQEQNAGFNEHYRNFTEAFGGEAADRRFGIITQQYQAYAETVDNGGRGQAGFRRHHRPPV